MGKRKVPFHTISIRDESRFLVYVEKSEDGCWTWTGKSRSGEGMRYGLFRANGKYQGAHRVAWQIVHGAIPAGMHVCHHCDNPICVRPDHLFLGTHLDNMRDMVAKGRNRHGRKKDSI